MSTPDNWPFSMLAFGSKEKMPAEEQKAAGHLSNILGRYLEPEDLAYAGFENMEQAVDAFVHFDPNNPSHQKIRTEFDEQLSKRALARGKVRKPGITPQQIEQERSIHRSSNAPDGDLNFLDIPGASYSRVTDNLLGPDDAVLNTYLRDANFINEITGRGHLKNNEDGNALDRIAAGETFDSNDDGSPQEHGFASPEEKAFPGMPGFLDNDTFSLNPTHEDLESVGMRVPEARKENGGSNTRFNSMQTANANYEDSLANPGKTATAFRTFTPQTNILEANNIGNTAYTKNMQWLDYGDTGARAARMNDGSIAPEWRRNPFDPIDTALSDANQIQFNIRKMWRNLPQASKEQNAADWADSNANSLSPVVPDATPEGRKAFIDMVKEDAQAAEVKSAEQYSGENNIPISDMGILVSEFGLLPLDVPTMATAATGTGAAAITGLKAGLPTAAKIAAMTLGNSVKDEFVEPGNIPYGTYLLQKHGPDLSNGVVEGLKNFATPKVQQPGPNDTWTQDAKANDAKQSEAIKRIHSLREFLDPQ